MSEQWPMSDEEARELLDRVVLIQHHHVTPVFNPREETAS